MQQFIIHVSQHDGEDNAIGPFPTWELAEKYIEDSTKEIELVELAYQIIELQPPEIIA